MRAERDYEPGEERDPAPEDLITPVLDQLAAVDTDFDFKSMAAQWERRGCLTPKQMGLVGWRLDHHGISHTPSEFAVRTTRPEDIEAIRDMPDWKVDRLRPYLTEQQIADLEL